MRVFVIGGTGLVGRNLVEEFESADHEVQSTSRSTDGADVILDKTDPKATREAISEFAPGAVIDTAAFHAVDDCESERDRAWSVNATGTRNAAVAAEEVGAQFVYLSTDYVFPGEPEAAPYSERDSVAPINYYARTKLAGEQAAMIPERWTVLRPSVIYGLASDNFVTWALGELENGNEIGIVDDQVSRPTYAPDLAAASLEILEEELTELFHSTGPTSVSRFEFTRILADTYGYDTDLVAPISTAEFGQEAARPRDSSLDSTRFYEALGYEFRAPEAAFEEMLQSASS